MKAKERRKKRKWCYTQTPDVFGFDPCPTCGNPDIDWSEWEKHCWCAKCFKDYIPEHSGVFDGPIPLRLANMLGMRFDKYDIKTSKVTRQEEYLQGYQTVEEYRNGITPSVKEQEKAK